MFKSAASKVMWVGKATVFLVGLTVILALVFGVASTAMGANGQAFILGNLKNAATKMTKLTGNVAGKPAVQIVNPNKTAGSQALQLIAAPNKSPLVVNPTAGKALNLNADKLDGKDSTSFALAARTPIWAVVNADSTIRRSSPGVTGFIGVGDGFYQLTFNRDVSSCAYFATLDGGERGEISTYRGIVDSGNTVRVATRDSSGANTPKAFYLAVLC